MVLGIPLNVRWTCIYILNLLNRVLKQKHRGFLPETVVSECKCWLPGPGVSMNSQNHKSSFQGWNRYGLEDPAAVCPALPENCQWKSPFLPCQSGLGKSSKLFKIPRQFWEVTVTNLCNWSIFLGFATPTLLHRWELKGRRTLQGCVFLKEKWNSASCSSINLIIHQFSQERGALKLEVNNNNSNLAAISPVLFFICKRRFVGQFQENSGWKWWARFPLFTLKYIFRAAPQILQLL